MCCEDNEPDVAETTHQKPVQEKKQRTPEENRKISDEMAKGQSAEADDD